MPFSNIYQRRAAIRRHYYANRQHYIEKNYRRREELRKYVRDLKMSTACKDCGESYPYYVMDFDHLENKEFSISRLVYANNKTKLRFELEKCEIVCANCHRIRTYERLVRARSSVD